VALSSGINNSALTFTVTPAGTGYPTGGTGKFVICMDGGTASEEKLLCTARSSAVFTVDPGGRGYDNTNATSHNTGAAVTHVMAAAEIDDASRHINNTSSDDHTQYVLANGTRNFTGAQAFGSDILVGGMAHVVGNLQVDGTTSLAGLSGGATTTTTLHASGAVTLGTTLGVTGAVTGSSTVQGTALAATLAGNGRYVGATTGTPSTGTYLTGDFASDSTNDLFWICTAGGTPGTWVQVGAGATDTAWTAVSAFTNSWVSFGAPEFAPGFRLVNGWVRLRGCMKSGTSGTAAFTLPSGYRPTATCGFPAVANGAFASVSIASTGAVTATGSNASFFLDNISFDTLS
jgi:hypothetical protein